jgi:hypothetical protein
MSNLEETARLRRILELTTAGLNALDISARLNTEGYATTEETIKNFLKIFNSMLDEETPVFEYKKILDDLDTGVSICGASCPCPACASV